jgi:hypothetical protein
MTRTYVLALAALLAGACVGGASGSDPGGGATAADSSQPTLNAYIGFVPVADDPSCIYFALQDPTPNMNFQLDGNWFTTGDSGFVTVGLQQGHAYSFSTPGLDAYATYLSGPVMRAPTPATSVGPNDSGTLVFAYFDDSVPSLCQ